MRAFWLLLAALTTPAAAAERRVATVEALRTALAAAVPGDVLVLAPGRHVVDHTIAIDRPGSPAAPITLRAARLGEAILAVTANEAFRVSAPHWVFANLVVEGTCADDGECEHAFHIVGAAAEVAIRDSRLLDFNAPIKVNGTDGRFPDHGTVERTEFAGRHPRATANPVTAIDIVAANGWVVRGNRIADFVKAGGNRISYAGFMKGGGNGGVFEDNVVTCSDVLAPQAADEARIGLSFGGGGTEAAYCRDRACRFEHRGGLMRNNRITGCSDVGIYLNQAAETRVIGNTLRATAGIDVRFPASSALIRDTVLDGRIRERDGGRATVVDYPLR